MGRQHSQSIHTIDRGRGRSQIMLLPLALLSCSHTFLLNVGLPKNVTLAYPPSVETGRVALLTTWFGAYPCIGCSSNKTRWCNGGLPQLTNYSRHEAQMRRDMNISIPDPAFEGFIVHDYEAWSPPWGRASDLYRNASIALARSGMKPGTPEKVIEAQAERQYDKAALTFLTFTIQLTRRLRPQAAGVGFYGYPSHTYTGPRAPLHTQCPHSPHDVCTLVSLCGVGACNAAYGAGTGAMPPRNRGSMTRCFRCGARRAPSFRPCTCHTARARAAAPAAAAPT